MPYFGIPIRNGLPIGLGSVAGFGAFQFSPSVLFAAGEQGAWYDPSDATTLFQDAAGTTPTTMETRVRLMLDKSKGLVLGPELVTNGDFSSGTTGWAGTNATLAVVGGQLEVTATASSNIYAGQTISVAVGKTYKFTATIRAPSANTGVNAARSYLYTTSGLGVPILTGASFAATAEDVSLQITGIFTATDVTVFVQLGVGSSIAWGSSGDKAYFDNISVRELPGNHAVAPSDASSPILRARYNLLTYSEDFSNAAWLKSGVTVTPNATTAPDGTLTADLLSQDNSNAVHPIYQTITSQSGTCRVRISAKPGNGQNILQILKSGDVNGYANFDIGNGQLGTVGSSASNATITAAQNGFYECAVDLAAYGGFCFFMLAASASAGYYEGFQGSASNGIYIWGADVRTSSDAALNIPAYQSITTATSYDTNGFPPYLAFDGTDDSFSTASIDFTGTDKMTVFAGVTKLSDAARGILVELSNTSSNPGTFAIEAPSQALVNELRFFATGSTTSRSAQLVGSAYAAPASFVATGIGDIAAPLTRLRANNAEASNTGALGATNFTNAALFIGRRANTSQPFNGRIYSLIIRGAATTTPLIASTEQWVAGKMRLPI